MKDEDIISLIMFYLAENQNGDELRKEAKRASEEFAAKPVDNQPNPTKAHTSDKGAKDVGNVLSSAVIRDDAHDDETTSALVDGIDREIQEVGATTTNHNGSQSEIDFMLSDNDVNFNHEQDSVIQKDCESEIVGINSPGENIGNDASNDLLDSSTDFADAAEESNKRQKEAVEKSASIESVSWDTYHSALNAYIKEHGHPPQTREDNPELYDWIQLQQERQREFDNLLNSC